MNYVQARDEGDYEAGRRVHMRQAGGECRRQGGTRMKMRQGGGVFLGREGGMYEAGRRSVVGREGQR